MICPKCNKGVFKQSDGYKTCLHCGKAVFDETPLPVHRAVPEKRYKNKTQEEITSEIKNGLAKHKEEIGQLRLAGIAWATISETVGLIGSVSSLSKHWKIMNPSAQVAKDGAKKRTFVNHGKKINRPKQAPCHY